MEGSHLNSEILEKALDIIPAYPTGAPIEIANGRLAGLRGVVAYVDMEHLQRPVIRLIWNADGKRIKPVEVDLLASEAIEIRSAEPVVESRAAAAAG